MGALDPQGIYIYDDTENWSPQDDYQNLGQTSVSNAIADVRAEIADLELLVDSGWVPITTFTANWTPVAGHQPRVRKVGDRVDMFGVITFNTGANTGDIMTLPAGYWPSGTYTATVIGGSVTNKGTAFAFMVDSGVPGHVRIASGYATKSFVGPEAVPLNASWYVS